jgi:hypothetical protein
MASHSLTRILYVKEGICITYWAFVLCFLLTPLTLQPSMICSKTYLHRLRQDKQRAQELDGRHFDEVYG